MAWNILREGFRVGYGTHHQRTGVFVIQGGSEKCRVQLARERSRTRSCTEFIQCEAVNGWSVPVVLAFVCWSDVHVTLVEDFRSNDCFKGCIRYPVGFQRALPTNAMLIVSLQDMQRYAELHVLYDRLRTLGPFMMCGGRTRNGEHENLYWASPRNNLGPTCGRYMPLRELLEGERAGWARAEKSGVWRCAACRANGGSDFLAGSTSLFGHVS